MESVIDERHVLDAHSVVLIQGYTVIDEFLDPEAAGEIIHNRSVQEPKLPVAPVTDILLEKWCGHHNRPKPLSIQCLLKQRRFKGTATREKPDSGHNTILSDAPDQRSQA